jgi:diketogulonate reductase-like aldo/keto reductase
LIDWSIASASSSLDTSLHRLGVDHVDLLLLHEPDAKLISSDEFLNWLMAQQAKGKVRAWGLAGEAARIVPWLSCDHRLAMVLQVRDSVDRKEADLLTTWGRNPQITYGYCSAACIHQQKIGPAEVLELAMRRNATGSILMSSLNVGHVRELAVLAETFDGSDN